MIRLPPRPPRTDTLFPYTPLSRSEPEQTPPPEPAKPPPPLPKAMPPIATPSARPQPPAPPPKAVRPPGGPVYGPPDTRRSSSSSGDSEVVGTAPNGEPLYAGIGSASCRERVGQDV